MIEFGAYEVIQTVAAGSTGTVYKAWHREIHRTAAIKELSPELRNSAAVIQRFRTEAHVGSSILTGQGLGFSSGQRA